MSLRLKVWHGLLLILLLVPLAVFVYATTQASAPGTADVVQCASSYTDGPASSQSVTLTNVVAGHNLVIFAHWDYNDGGVGTTSVTITGTTAFTLVDTASDGCTNTCDRFTNGYALNVAAGTHTGTLTPNVAGQTLRVSMCEISGTLTLDQHTWNYQFPAPTTANGVTTGPVTTTSSPTLIVGLFENNASTPPNMTAGSGFTIPPSGKSGGVTQTVIETMVQQSPGTVAATMTRDATGSGQGILSSLLAFTISTAPTPVRALMGVGL